MSYTKALSFTLRLAVTCGIFIYIFTKVIALDDHIVLKDKSVVRGDILSVDAERVHIDVHGKTLQYRISEIADQKNTDRKAIHPGFFKIWKQLHIPLFFLFSTLFFVDLFICTFRLKWFLASQGISTSYLQLTRINFMGHFFNNFLPGSTGGDIVRAYYVARDAEQKTNGVVAVVMDRIIGMSALAILAGGIVFFHLKKQEFFIPALIIYACLGGILFGGILIFSVPERLYARRHNLMSKIIAAFCNYRFHPRILLWSVALSICVHILTNLAVFGFARALGIYHVPWFVFFIYVPVGLLVMAVPISISGWGVGEAIFAYLFSQVGVLYEQGVVLCLLIRLAQIELGVIGGILWMSGRRTPPAP